MNFEKKLYVIISHSITSTWVFVSSVFWFVGKSKQNHFAPSINTLLNPIFFCLGWMPLDYLLALHGLKWLLKCRHRFLGEELQRRAGEGSTRGSGNCQLFTRAYEFLIYLAELSGSDLLSIHILRDDGPLRDALYMDLTRCWSDYQGAAITRFLHPEWKSDNIDMGMRTMFGRSLVHGAACGRGILGVDSVSGVMFCRGGCLVDETLDHVVLHCPCYSRQRSRLRDVCSRVGVGFGVRTVMNNPQVLPVTEDLFV